jgi:histidinol dehydrogenase
MATGRKLISELKLMRPAGLPGLLRRLRPAEARAAEVEEGVRGILAAVRRGGDRALVAQVRAHDWACPGPEALRVPEAMLEQALRNLHPGLRSALRSAEKSIRTFHARQRPARCATVSGRGARMGIEALPLDSVGLYVPGGRAAYPSTLLMLAVPAQVAGVRRIAVATPAGPEGMPNTTVLAAAALLGVTEVYAIGGAAAVGAFAYGTETVARVDKVLGPGNAWVAEAKRQVFGVVGIDAVAGPTELVILSDGTSPARLIAADLLAQAEHDPEASPVLLTTDPEEPARVGAELARQLASSPRSGIQRESLRRRGALVACANKQLACAAARALAPEHLSVMTRRASVWARLVPTASAVFLGPYTPEAAGDYGAGPNHSLPTGGTARFASPVGVWDYFRYRSTLELDRGALARMAPWMRALALAEGLAGHAASLDARAVQP